ncbi:hypothetical protein HG537_0A03340 [Torulaspora globosa]|uniref:Bromo domain-containing protein n=1 Tax=Torulaspora globosa TaxID=48254 RepID=A0A7H9HMV1_9SACH|nr:hypothetical protein HG537_0A03340 [Torulaspora sp. CBS 2947]
MRYRASSKCKVLDESFPCTFYEKDPNKIFTSYCTYIKRRSDSYGVIKSEDKLKLITISQKFEEGMYAPEQGGFYRLYHDIKLVCTMLIHYYSQGTRNYQMVDKFYKFATELILRECYKVGISVSNSKTGTNSKLAIETDTELDSVIAHDFIKISTNYKVPVAETYYIKTRELELFSSMIAKSQLDNRPQELPNSNFEINKVIPQTNICEEAPKLGFVAANTSNIPDPTLPPTEMMTRFLHPNWYALPTTMWLKYGDYKPWAPSFNENGTVIDSTTRGIIWLQRVGYLQIYEDAENALEDKKEESNEPVDMKKSDNDVHEEKEKDELQNGESSTVDNKEEMNDEDQEAASDDLQKPNVVEQHTIKLENLFDWKPSNYIDDDEIEGFKEGTHSELVTSILLKIRNLRKDRLMNKIIKPSAEEIKLYNKARRILKEVVLAKQIKALPMKHCRSFPVLQANYNGSIPVVRLQPTRKRKPRK